MGRQHGPATPTTWRRSPGRRAPQRSRAKAAGRSRPRTHERNRNPHPPRDARFPSASHSPRASPPTAKRSAPQAREASAALESINPSPPEIGEEFFGIVEDLAGRANDARRRPSRAAPSIAPQRQNSRPLSAENTPPTIAAAGIVKIQAQTMLPATPQRTAEAPRTLPTPTMAPVMVWVV